MIFSQISDMINMGLVVLDTDLKVHFWNRWMALHSGIDSETIVGQSLFDFFPNLDGIVKTQAANFRIDRSQH